MFLHLINPDPKFPPLIRSMFETAMPGEHVYVLLGDCEGVPHVWEEFSVVKDPEDFRRILDAVDRLDGVILNGVLEKAHPYTGLIPEGVPLAWVVWGGEFYEHLNGSGLAIYGALTERYLEAQLINYLRKKLRPYYWKLRGRSCRTTEVLRGISYVVTQLAAEYKTLKLQASLSESCRHIELPVLLLEDLVDVNRSSYPAAGMNIQVGNSAKASNNHLEVFEVLRHLDLAGRKVLVPLSYGDPGYRRLILAEGKRMLGDTFQPITEFMPLKDYLALMESCSVVIMNHYRQQALGNIIAALWRGARVYLGPCATLSAYSEWGLSVFAFDSSFTVPAISSDEVAKKAVSNAAILEERLGRQTVLSRLSGWLAEMKKGNV